MDLLVEIEEQGRKEEQGYGLEKKLWVRRLWVGPVCSTYVFRTVWSPFKEFMKCVNFLTVGISTTSGESGG